MEYSDIHKLVNTKNCITSYPLKFLATSKSQNKLFYFIF